MPFDRDGLCYTQVSVIFWQGVMRACVRAYHHYATQRAVSASLGLAEHLYLIIIALATLSNTP